MKRLGLIGGTDASLVEAYWQTINREAAKYRDDNHPAPVIVNCHNGRSLSLRLQERDWSGMTATLIEEAREAMLAGAEGLVICGSALALNAAEVCRSLDIPIIEMTRAMALRLRDFRFRRIAVLGAQTVREERMWREKLTDHAVVFPSSPERTWLGECAASAFRKIQIPVEWKIETHRIISSLRRKDGAQAVILADHTLARWVKPNESLLQPFDAAVVHAWTAALWALETPFVSTPLCPLRT